MIIIYELGFYDQEISYQKKKAKPLRTLPKSSKPMAMVCNVTQMSFNDYVDLINAEIERH